MVVVSGGFTLLEAGFCESVLVADEFTEELLSSTGGGRNAAAWVGRLVLVLLVRASAETACQSSKPPTVVVKLSG